jgi:acyl-coenzyme A thioesterase PaaI-like protein
MSDGHTVAADVASAIRRGDRHFVVDLEITALLVTRTRCLVRAPFTDAVRSPSGGASLGMLMTLVDVGASDPAMVACRPDWTATQDLAMHGAGPITDGPIVVDHQLVRAGSKVVVVAANAYDGHGEEDLDALRAAIDARTAARADDSSDDGPTLAASGVIAYARIPGSAAPGMDDYDPAAWVGELRHSRARTPAAGTMYARMGLQTVDTRTGTLELARTPYVSNSIGTINGGALAVLTEAAAEALRPGMVATDMQIHYLSQVKAGPARTVATVLRDASDHSVVQVQLVDGGNDDHLLAVATVTVCSAAG